LNTIYYIKSIYFNQSYPSYLTSYQERHTADVLIAVLIAVHGAGLTHAFEMHPHRWRVEIFTSSKPFILTYSIASKLMSHTHLVINDGKPFVPSWEATGNWAQEWVTPRPEQN
jgi:hypothetical protein